MKPGLYANIHKKRERIKRGSGETMRKPGSKGAPTTAAFLKSDKTAKKYCLSNLKSSAATSLLMSRRWLSVGLISMALSHNLKRKPNLKLKRNDNHP
jgi:hypothetical protein